MRKKVKNAIGLKSKIGSQVWKAKTMMYILIDLGKLLERI
jgi:hypothetical protein